MAQSNMRALLNKSLRTMATNAILKSVGRVLMIAAMPLFLCFQCEEDYAFLCYREIYNATSQTICVEYHSGRWNNDVLWEATIGPNEVAVVTRPLVMFDRRADVKLEDSVMDLKCSFVFYNSDKTKVLYTMDVDGCKDRKLWKSERFQTYPEAKTGDEFVADDPFAYHTFVYWTFTLTDEMFNQ